jgi:hypothetical protein
VRVRHRELPLRDVQQRHRPDHLESILRIRFRPYFMDKT